MRSVANSLLPAGMVRPDALGRALVLGHAGVTTHTNDRLRMAVASGTLDRIGDAILPFIERSDDAESASDDLARFIALCAASA